MLLVPKLLSISRRIPSVRRRSYEEGAMKIVTCPDLQRCMTESSLRWCTTTRDGASTAPSPTFFDSSSPSSCLVSPNESTASRIDLKYPDFATSHKQFHLNSLSKSVNQIIRLVRRSSQFEIATSQQPQNVSRTASCLATMLHHI